MTTGAGVGFVHGNSEFGPIHEQRNLSARRVGLGEGFIPVTFQAGAIAELWRRSAGVLEFRVGGTPYSKSPGHSGGQPEKNGPSDAHTTKFKAGKGIGSTQFGDRF